MEGEGTVKKSKVYSCSATEDFIEKLDSAARKMGWGRSELVRTLVNKHLGLVVNDKDEVPIVLRVPSRLRNDPEGLRKWLDVKAAYLYKKLCNVPSDSPGSPA